jgi:hypothetical protein
MLSSVVFECCICIRGEGISSRVGGLREVSRWKHSPRCESSECDRDMANPSVSSATSSEVRGDRTHESQTFRDLGRARQVA